jgi:hypothetical protein
VSAIEWLGPGRAALVVAAEPAATPAPAALPAPVTRLVRSREEAQAVLRQDVLAREGGDDGRAAVESYFAAGGAGCLLVADPRFGDPDWAGEDGGPGFRSGVPAIAEADDIGLVVVAAPSSARRLEGLRACARAWPRKLFVAAVEVGAAAVTRHGDNVASVAGPRGGSSLAGALAAYLEAADFQLDAPAAAPPLPAGLGQGDARWLRELRRAAGLWRSIDEGTRWSVFDLDHELTWRRVEREVGTFLARLDLAGFFGRTRGAWSVSCRPALLAPASAGHPAGTDVPCGAIQLHVEVPAAVLAGAG